MSQSKIRPYVDVLKLFFAGCIVLLHYGVVNQIPYSDFFCAIIVRLAVPYFFVASGYFFANYINGRGKILEGKHPVYVYLKRLGVKLLVFVPVLAVIHAAYRMAGGMTFGEIFALTVKEVLFYPYVLWYILAVMIAAIMLTPIVQKKMEKKVIILALALYLIAILNNRYYFLIEKAPISILYSWYENIFISTRNGIFVGFPFMLCGCLISRYEDKLLMVGKNNTKRLAILVGGLFGICIGEYMLLRPYSGHDDNSLYISYLLLIPALFALSAQMEGVSVNTTVLRNLSTSIYLLHSPIKRVCAAILKILLKIDSIWIVSITSILVMLLVCTVIYKKKWQPFYRWIV